MTDFSRPPFKISTVSLKPDAHDVDLTHIRFSLRSFKTLYSFKTVYEVTRQTAHFDITVFLSVEALLVSSKAARYMCSAEHAAFQTILHRTV